MPIVVQCNSCKKKIKAAEKFAGKRVKCPGCQAVLAIPAAAASGPATPAPSPVAPTPKPAAPAPQAAASSLLDDEIPTSQNDLPPMPSADPLASMLDDDIPIRQEAAAPSTASTPANCPGCGAAVQTGAVLCVDCGYDFRAQTKRGQQIGEDDSGGKKKKKKKRRSSTDSGRMIQILKGCGISAISVVIGIVIWYGIAMLTGFELGIIAWMLGGAAGIGMAVGCGDNGTNAFTGLLAAMITFIGIFIARLAILLTILIPMAFAAANNADEFFDEEFMEEEFGDEMAFEDMEMAAEEGEDGEAAEVDPELEAEMAAMEAEMEKALEEAMAEAEEMPEIEIGLGTIIIGFFVGAGILMFGGIWQAVFVILACFTAFKVGMTGVMDED